ncbi:hypothetical protein Dacsa_3352 [Dactylococcopsis salina PCC 8305]|uniref:Uncharacterized protein n=1 Tax=Dactylococcopsis salina (strain PCC 8305) TaxID=13035 RepID=K9YY32_DACS8|nr:hypothetical protein Dacsa_3352 [Dactylococcopsis salina PCC 8305]
MVTHIASKPSPPTDQSTLLPLASCLLPYLTNQWTFSATPNLCWVTFHFTQPTFDLGEIGFYPADG